MVGDIETTFWETSWYLVGLEKLMIDMMMETPYVEPLFDKVMEVNLEIGKTLIRLGADILWAGDDFGSQQGMLVDPSSRSSMILSRSGWTFSIPCSPWPRIWMLKT